jgi:fructose/tagatose bisphosphate aldolase
MTLVPQAEMFAEAKSGGYAVGSFNVTSLEMAYGVVDAAESLNSPVILAVTEGHRLHFQLGPLTAGLRVLARDAAVSVGLHLDHAESIETAARALRMGFTSIMYDGPPQPWAHRLAETRELTRIAHGMGVLVEGSVSAQSRQTAVATSGSWELPSDDIIDEFLSTTNVDILAIGEGSSDLDPTRVSAISSATGKVTSLHGGSQLSNEQVAAMIASGLRKCSVYGKIASRAFAILRERASDEASTLLDVVGATRSGFAEGVRVEIERLGSADQNV